MGEKEGAAGLRSPGNDKSQRVGPFCRDNKDICSKGNPYLEEKRDRRHSSERQRNPESPRTSEDSGKRQGHTRPREEAKYSRQKRKSPYGSPPGHKEPGNLEKKLKGSLYGPGEQGCKHEKPCGQNRRSQPRSHWRTSGHGRSQRTPGARQSCAQRPGAPRAPLLSPLCRLSAHMDALAVAMGELQAPGGAFLRVPARGTEPTASQRAWLCWQLAHAGAALYGALVKVNAMLAAQPWPPGMPEEPAHLSRGAVHRPEHGHAAPNAPGAPRAGRRLHQS